MRPKKKKKKNGYIALIWAAENGHLHVVNRLLNCDEIDVNLQDVVKWEIV